MEGKPLNPTMFCLFHITLQNADFWCQVELFSGICLCDSPVVILFPFRLDRFSFLRRLRFMIESTQNQTLTAYYKSFRLYFINVNHVNGNIYTQQKTAEIIIRRKEIHNKAKGRMEWLQLIFNQSCIWKDLQKKETRFDLHFFVMNFWLIFRWVCVRVMEN